MLLGIEDLWVWLAYVLCILSTVLCVAWGALRWNKDDAAEPDEEVRHWVEEEDKVEEEL